MFGYINANKDEFNEEEKATYQGFYCGLCQELKRQAGAKGQMLLNYDMTFLVILLSGLYELKATEADFTCKMHPLKKKHSLTTEATEYAASMDIILSYYNLLDDYMDEGSHCKKIFVDYLQNDYDAIKNKYPRQVAAIEKYIDAVNAAEKANETNLDIISGYTGEMMEELFEWREGDIWAADLRTMGFYMGKFIYILDAYEDREKDLKKGQYNPMQLQYEQNADGYETFTRQTLTSLMAESAKAFERMPILEYAPILRNIIYSGVWTRYEYKQLKDKTKGDKNGSV